MSEHFRDKLKQQHRVFYIASEENFLGSAINTFRGHSGARVLFDLNIRELGSGGKVTLVINNGPSETGQKEILRKSFTSTGIQRFSFADTYQYYVTNVLVENNQASFDLSATVSDQSSAQDEKTTTTQVGSTNALDVNVVSGSAFSNPPREVVNTFNEISSVNANNLSTIVSYTAPANKETYLQKAVVSGTNIAVYQVELNGTIQDKHYTYFGAPLTTTFLFQGQPEGQGLTLSPGDQVVVKVEHQRPYPGDFNGRVQAIEFA